MTEKPRKMNMKTGQGVDIDSLIAGADPITAKVTATKPKQSAPKQPATKKTPWSDKASEGRVNMPLYTTPEMKAMMDYLRDKTGVPTQVTLRKIIEPELRKQAEKIFKENSK